MCVRVCFPNLEELILDMNLLCMIRYDPKEINGAQKLDARLFLFAVQRSVCVVVSASISTEVSSSDSSSKL